MIYGRGYCSCVELQFYKSRCVGVVNHTFLSNETNREFYWSKNLFITMSSGKPYIGCKLGLISKAQNRYEGILFTIDTINSTVVLEKGELYWTPSWKKLATPFCIYIKMAAVIRV